MAPEVKTGPKTKQPAKAAGNYFLYELERTFVFSTNELAGIALCECILIDDI